MMAPEIVLPLLDGGVYNSTASRGTPAIFNIFEPASAFSTCLWQCNASIDELILRAAHKDAPRGAPPQFDLVFASHGAASAAEDVEALRTLIEVRLDRLGITSVATRAAWRTRLH